MVRLSEKVRAVLVLLHGSGDSGPGVRSIMKATAGGHLLSRLAAAGVDVVCPTAVPRSYRLQPGAERMSVWCALARRALAGRARAFAARVAEGFGILIEPLRARSAFLARPVGSTATI